MKNVAHAVVDAKLGVLDSDNKMVDLKGGLLCFEPFIGFERSILNELFKEDDQIPVEDEFFFEIAKYMHKDTDYIIELFKTCPIRLANLMDCAPPSGGRRWEQREHDTTFANSWINLLFWRKKPTQSLCTVVHICLRNYVCSYVLFLVEVFAP